MMQVLIFYLVTIVMFYKNKFKLFVILFLIVILDLFVPYLDSNGYVYIFDVGQGDCSLVITPNRRDVVLIDTGGKFSFSKEEWMVREPYYVSDNVISFMKSIGIRNIDYMILTHGDYDHMGDAINIVNKYKINKVLFNKGEYNGLEKNLIDKLNILDIPYDIVNSFYNDYYFTYFDTNNYDNENDNSTVMLSQIYNYSFLFMGDAGTIVEDEIISKYDFNRIDVLKVGHHGSKTSSGKNFIDAINPKYSIISLGKNNKFGHPSDSVLNNLNDSKIYRTDQEGSVMFKISNDKLEIKTFVS